MKCKEELDYLPEKTWKRTNAKYVCAIQKFIDIANNIEEEQLRKKLIYQMLHCEKIITEIAEEMIENGQRIK